MSTSLDPAFNKFPRLETERLILREITDDDAPALFGALSDFEWLRLWGFPVHKTVEDTRAWIASLKQAYKDRTQVRWGICLKGNDTPIGSAGFYRFMPHHFRAEITYEQARHASGQGYMTEALKAIVRFGFEQLDLHSIEAGIDPEHPASIRVAKRLGMQQEGYLHQNYFFQGRFYDTVLFTLLSGRPATRTTG